MSVGAFAADFGFHFGGSRIVEAGNIGFLFGFGFHFGFAFGFLFFPLKTIPPIIASSILISFIVYG